MTLQTNNNAINSCIDIMANTITEQLPSFIQSYFQDHNINKDTVNEISRFCQIMKSEIQAHEQHINESLTANLADIQSLIQQELAPLVLQLDTLKQDNIRLNGELDSLKLVNQSSFVTVEEQANSISENKKEILLQNRTIQLLEEYVHSTIPSLASTVDDDL